MVEANLYNKIDLFLKQEIKNILENRIVSDFIDNRCLNSNISNNNNDIELLFEDEYSRLQASKSKDTLYILEIFIITSFHKFLIERWEFIISGNINK
jgi:hypothetical protein